jgi:hypothetical protein
VNGKCAAAIKISLAKQIGNLAVRCDSGRRGNSINVAAEFQRSAGIHRLCSCRDWPLPLSTRTSQHSTVCKYTVHIKNHFLMWVPVQIHSRTRYNRTGYRENANDSHYANINLMVKVWQVKLKSRSTMDKMRLHLFNDTIKRVQHWMVRGWQRMWKER